MARSNFSTTIRDHAVVRHKYYWPEIHLTFYIIFMIISGLFLIVRYADLAQEQSRLGLGTPWIISYGITVGALTEAFAWATLFLSWQRKLVPRIFLLYTFILLVLYITGIIGTAIQLNRVIPACRREVDNNNQKGPNTDTLIWLNQNHTCENWYVAFAFWVTSTVLMIWIMFVARSVDDHKDDKVRDR